MPWTDRLPRAAQRLAGIGVRAEDSADVRLDKAMFTLLTALIGVMSCAWVGIYLAIGLPRSAAIPFTYQVAVVITLMIFARTRQFAAIRTTQLVLMSALPFLLQWSLGGFANGSAVAAWAGVTPVLAHLFGARRTIWMLLFFALLIVSAAMETTLAADAPAIDASLRAALFAMNIVGPSLAVFFALSYFTDQRDRSRAALVEEHRLLEAERDRSESLLLNMLPAPIAHRLRASPTTIAEGAPAVTVLFADLVGFTPLAGSTDPAALVALLNEVFSAFDELADAAGLEKIKTIGDAYMLAGGIPVPREDHLYAVLTIASQMLARAASITAPDGRPLRLRIGVATGPVVAGVIGLRKFSYDLWGDTVNSASRMESHGEPGRIHVTAEVARLAADRFEFAARPPIEVKGKGTMQTYFLARARPLAAPPPP